MIYSISDRRMETAGDDYYVAPDAQVIGSVRLGHRSSVWFGCVIRGDGDWISIGDGSNVQDCTVIHTDEGFPTEIGKNVTIGHRALLHSCRIGEGSLIGNGAIVLDRVRIGRNCLVAAGTLLPPDKDIPDDSVVMGSPGKIVRTVTADDLTMMKRAAENYQTRITEYRKSLVIDPRSH